MSMYLNKIQYVQLHITHSHIAAFDLDSKNRSFEAMQKSVMRWPLSSCHAGESMILWSEWKMKTSGHHPKVYKNPAIWCQVDKTPRQQTEAFHFHPDLLHCVAWSWHIAALSDLFQLVSICDCPGRGLIWRFVTWGSVAPILTALPHWQLLGPWDDIVSPFSPFSSSLLPSHSPCLS